MRSRVLRPHDVRGTATAVIAPIRVNNFCLSPCHPRFSWPSSVVKNALGIAILSDESVNYSIRGHVPELQCRNKFLLSTLVSMHIDSGITFPGYH